MEVRRGANKQTRLQEIADRPGRNAEEVVEEAIGRMLDYDKRFIAAAKEGRVSARRGEFLEHDDIVQRIDKILSS